MPGSADLDWYLYTSSDLNFFAARGYTAYNPEEGTYYAPAAGTYYVKVVGYAGAMSSYSLLVTGAGVSSRSPLSYTSRAPGPASAPGALETALLGWRVSGGAPARGHPSGARRARTPRPRPRWAGSAEAWPGPRGGWEGRP